MWAWVSIMPGSTSLPRTSMVCLADDGMMLLLTWAILPSAIATSMTPSMPEAGQITWPPCRMRSLTGAAFMTCFLLRIRIRLQLLGDAQISALHVRVLEQLGPGPGHGDAPLLQNISAVA